MSDINAIKRETLKGIFVENIASNRSGIADADNDNLNIVPTIESFTPSCEGFDTKIVALASSINSIKSEIVSIHATALADGCGDSMSVSTMFQDTVLNLSYKISDENYVDPDHSDFDGPVNNPYDIVSAVLTSGNVGYGTFSKHIPDDPTTGIGDLYASIGSGGSSCADYATQIAEKESQITLLRNELIGLTTAVNVIKEERVPYHYRRFRNKVDIIELNAQNVRFNIALEAINNSALDPYTT